MEEKNITLLLKEEKKEVLDKKEVSTINVFSSKSFEETIVENPTKTEQKTYSSVIEKPNYDFIEKLSPEEEKTVYSVKKEVPIEKPNLFAKRLRIILFSLCFGVCSIWGLVNIVNITQLDGQIGAASEIYELNLANYLTKLGTLDSASNYNELFDTYPELPSPPTEIAKSSNWFDRICNFIAGLFGG